MVNPIVPGLFGSGVAPGGGGLFLPAGHISRTVGDKTMKFGTEVALHKGSKKIKSKWQLLPWLPDDVITKCQNRQNLYIT